MSFILYAAAKVIHIVPFNDGFVVVHPRFWLTRQNKVNLKENRD